MVEPSCDCKLRRVTLPLSARNERFESVENTVVRIEHGAPG
ncbi:hypothetical protein SS05631_c35020 [Sinorhizobium sp. CCBAU 05631]|nr:hypothetical protein SS05631_c35020 [Sinorhizobium sp. CCBAU 05631]